MSNPTVQDKCGPDGLCKWMFDRAAVGQPKGFRHLYTIKLSAQTMNAAATWRGISYHMSTRDRGVLVNFCPFCGGKPGPLANNCEVAKDGKVVAA